jgi:glycosyltransferase involved in cell wall biosynthesis
MPNPIDLQKFQRKPCDRNSLRPGRIAMLGRLISLKNVQVGLQSLRLLESDYELWVIGDGPEKLRLEEQAHELGIGKRVRFWGQRNDVHELLREADLLWLLSDREGQPMAGVEAMAVGLPVIGADVRGINELISHEKNGLLVPVNQPNAVAAATVRLLNDGELWRKLVAGGFETVEARSLDKVSAQHLGWYAA